MKTIERMLDLHPIVWMLLTGSAIIRIATSMSVPFIAIFLTTQKKTGMFETGWSLSAAALATLLSGFFIGYISDRFGFKRTILGSILLSALLLIMFAVAGYALSSGLVVLVFSVINFLFNLARRSYDPVAQAGIAEVTPQELKVQVFGLRYWFVNVGSTLGPIIGGILGFSGKTDSFIVAGAIYFSFFLMLLYGLRKLDLPPILAGSTQSRFIDAFRAIRASPSLMRFIVALAFFMVGYSQVESGLAYLLHQLGETQQREFFAALLAINGLTVLILQIPLSAFVKKIGADKKYVLYSGTILMAFGVFLWGLAGLDRWIYVLGMVICTVGEIIVLPLSSVWIDTFAPTGYRATSFGVSGFSQIGVIAAPLLVGFLLEISSPWFAMGMIALIVLLATPLFHSSVQRYVSSPTLRAAATASPRGSGGALKAK